MSWNPFRSRQEGARRQRMADLQHDPSPEAGYEFWKLAAPDLEAGFWAARREIHARNGWA